jgi:hypothetical protein
VHVPSVPPRQDSNNDAAGPGRSGASYSLGDASYGVTGSASARFSCPCPDRAPVGLTGAPLEVSLRRHTSNSLHEPLVRVVALLDETDTRAQS